MKIMEKSHDINYDELFFKEISKIPVLSREETTKLFMQYEEATGEEKEILRNEITKHNLRLVLYVSKNYIGKGVEFADLFEEGILGLMESIDNFDYKRGTSFSPFAIFKIKNVIRKYLDVNANSVRRPTHMNEKLFKYRRVKDEMAVQLGQYPTNEQIADALGVTVKKIYEYERILQQPLYLDNSIKQDKSTNEKTHLDYLSNEEDEIEKLFDKLIIDELEYTIHHCGIKERDIEILKMRYGFYNNDEPVKLEDIAETFGVSRETVRNVEKTALKKLRSALISSRNKKDFCLDESKPYGILK